MPKVEDLCSVKIEQNPASLKFLNSHSPINEDEINAQNEELSTKTSLFIVGTYQIPENGSAPADGLSRLGGFNLIKSEQLEICHKSCINSEGGIFRFEQIGVSNKIIAALSSGEIGIFEVDVAQLKSISKILVTKNMLLDCNEQFGRIICTDSAGQLFLLDMETESVLSSLRAHQMPSNYYMGGKAIGNEPNDRGENGDNCEAWSCAWIDQTGCATGAEDACLKIWDFRSINSTANPIASMTNTQTHSAGITRIHRRGDHFLLTGSYDEHLRIFDTRQLQRPINEIKMPGGVWDLNPVGNEFLITACMYGGWSLVQLCPSLNSLQLVHSNSINDHLLYAVDARPLKKIGECGNANYLIASCTFDDSQIRLQKLII